MGNRFDALQEQMDKRLSAMGNDLQELAERMDRCMVWSCSTTMASRGWVITVLKPWLPDVLSLAGRRWNPPEHAS
jgi:hypothetical protein